jgi:hypothetical protein
MDDAARKLGERLLAKAQLTQAEIKSAVAEARDERAVEVEFERVKRLAWRLYGVTRLNAGKRQAVETCRELARMILGEKQ